MYKRLHSKASVTLAIFLFVSMFLVKSLPKSEAALLSSRNVVVGSSIVSATTTHQVNFSYATAASTGSVQFEYCTNSPFAGTPCTAPVGLSLSAASLSAQLGEGGFSIHPSSTVNNLILTRVPAVVAPGPAAYTFANVVNQSANQTVYIRVTTYASTDATGAYIDQGSVAYSTARGLGVDGFVPPYLTFCVGVTVAVNCSVATGDLLNFGELTTSEARALSSEFSGSTNDPAGYVVALAGTTMTSGNVEIPALDPPQPSAPGVSQFGMNLRANSSPIVGLDATGPGTTSPAPELDIPNQYFFKNQVIASSPLPTDFRKLTASYVVNVSAGQTPGIYTTTLTYIAVAAF